MKFELSEDEVDAIWDHIRVGQLHKDELIGIGEGKDSDLILKQVALKLDPRKFMIASYYKTL